MSHVFKKTAFTITTLAAEPTAEAVILANVQKHYTGKLDQIIRGSRSPDGYQQLGSFVSIALHKDVKITKETLISLLKDAKFVAKLDIKFMRKEDSGKVVFEPIFNRQKMLDELSYVADLRNI